MPTPHISAPDGAFAKTVLLAGDPLRAKFMADTFLTDAQMVTDVRNMYGFTGLYKGKRVSVMGSGMGMPSIGIYSYELYKFYDVENIIRIGSAGSYREELKLMDVVLATQSYSDSTYALMQNGSEDLILYPCPIINRAITQKAKELGIELKPARVHSSDVFYGDENKVPWQKFCERTQTDCVEMESFALFHNAIVLKKHAATLLTISDSFCSDEHITADQRQTALRNMITLALEATIEL